MLTFRSAILATTFAATVAVGLTAATLRGETKETSLDQTCSHVTWPMVPAQCLQGAGPQKVRYAMGGEATGTEMAARFATAFR